MPNDSLRVAGETTTDRNGRYTVSGLDLGSYSVRVVSPAGWTRTTRDPGAIVATRGTTLTGVDHGYVRSALGGTGATV